jgi:hypothetical protein
MPTELAPLTGARGEPMGEWTSEPMPGTHSRWVRVIVRCANEWSPAVRAGREEEEVARAVAARLRAGFRVRSEAADALTCTSRPTYDRSAVSVASRLSARRLPFGPHIRVSDFSPTPSVSPSRPKPTVALMTSRSRTRACQTELIICD